MESRTRRFKVRKSRFPGALNKRFSDFHKFSQYILFIFSTETQRNVYLTSSLVASFERIIIQRISHAVCSVLPTFTRVILVIYSIIQYRIRSIHVVVLCHMNISHILCSR